MKHYKPIKCVVCSKVFTPTAADQKYVLRSTQTAEGYGIEKNQRKEKTQKKACQEKQTCGNLRDC